MISRDYEVDGYTYRIMGEVNTVSDYVIWELFEVIGGNPRKDSSIKLKKPCDIEDAYKRLIG